MKYTLLTSFMLLIHLVNGQKLELFIYNIETLEPVEFASVFYNNVYFQSNSLGLISLVKMKSDTLKIHRLGFDKLETIVSKLHNTDTLYLNPTIQILEEIEVIRYKFNVFDSLLYYYNENTKNLLFETFSRNYVLINDSIKRINEIATIVEFKNISKINVFNIANRKSINNDPLKLNFATNSIYSNLSALTSILESYKKNKKEIKIITQKKGDLITIELNKNKESKAFIYCGTITYNAKDWQIIDVNLYFDQSISKYKKPNKMLNGFSQIYKDGLFKINFLKIDNKYYPQNILNTYTYDIYNKKLGTFPYEVYKITVFVKKLEKINKTLSKLKNNKDEETLKEFNFKFWVNYPTLNETPIEKILIEQLESEQLK